MIINESTLSQEDAVFLTKCVISEAMKTPRKKISGAVLLTGAAAMLLYAVLGLYLMIRFTAPTDIVIHTVLFGVLGILALLAFCFNKKIMLWRTMHAKEWNAMLGQAVRNVFEADAVTVYRSANGTETANKFAYTLIQGFTVQNGSLYIWVYADQRKKFLVLHDSGYTEGNRADVLALLHKYGVPMMQMP